MLKPAGTANASMDLVGLYTRIQGGELQIRLDFLDMQTERDCDVYVVIDLGAGGLTNLPIESRPSIGWEILLVAPAGGRPYALGTDGKQLQGVLQRVNRDALLDMMVFSLHRQSLPGGAKRFSLEAFATPPGTRLPASQIGPADSDSLPPGKANLLLAFWNALPADSPAQALRRWDGAHAGPLGQRHGLRLLLQAAEQNSIPLVLLDLKKPRSLSALDLVGGIEWVKNLEKKGLVVLPDVAWGDPSLVKGLEYSRKTADAFGFPGSPFLVGAIQAALPDQYQTIFAVLYDQQHILQWGKMRLVPLPGVVNFQTGGRNQPTRQGPALALRRELLNNALSGDPDSLVIQGGDLSSSTWGDRIVAENTLRYLANHPWIKVLTGKDLLALPAYPVDVCQPAEPAPCADWLCLTAIAGLEPIRTELLNSQPGPLTDLAWDTYLYLSDPMADIPLQKLRRNYLGQVSLLLEAARWADAPYHRSDCSTDLDGDDTPECLLANDHFLGVLKLDGARLVLGFYRTSAGSAQQFTGSMSQFAAGLSDPSQWQLDAGEKSDPGIIPGAFSDSVDPWKTFQAAASEDTLVFQSVDGTLTKTYRLVERGLKVQYYSQSPVQVSILLAVGSDGRFVPGWAKSYQSATQSTGITWGIPKNSSVDVSTSSEWSWKSFIDSSKWLTNPEDPDRSYPPGHFLPFPLAEMDISGSGSFAIDITFKP
jgi:hypothetical protein